MFVVACWLKEAENCKNSNQKAALLKKLFCAKENVAIIDCVSLQINDEKFSTGTDEKFSTRIVLHLEI